MSDKRQITAAILAAEAARQKAAISPQTKTGPGPRDITGELWAYYEFFMAKLKETDN